MTDYTDTQKIMMTLAALAATGATQRPSGETLKEQRDRIKAGITARLAEERLATGTKWSLIWVGLTKNRANLAYIAKGPDDGGSVYALVLRGTVMGDPIDQAEDMDVGELLDFTAGNTRRGLAWMPRISQGAMEAFTNLVMGMDTGDQLLDQLKRLSPNTLYVVGHSLGGAMATTVALFLRKQIQDKALSINSIRPYTFAAPTAGNDTFAFRLDDTVSTYNKYDLIPHAWDALTTVIDPTSANYYPFYPNPPGPIAAETPDVVKLIAAIANKVPNPNPYVQPGRPGSILNDGPRPQFQPYPAGATEMDKFMLQVAHQHQSDTYLKLMGAPVIVPDPLAPPVPVIAKVESASAAWGETVTITAHAGHFTEDCRVDFGVLPAEIDKSKSTKTMLVVTVPDGGYGTVDVRVTNNFGTSAVVPNQLYTHCNDRFTFTTP